MSAEDDLLLVSRDAMSVRFHATDDVLRPMGRSTSGVTGMKFRDGDSLLALNVIEDGTDPDVFVVFDNGVAKRTSASEWTAKGRSGLGVLAAKSGKGGRLVGALVVDEDDEVMVVMEKGNIVRSAVAEVNRTSRNTQASASPRRARVTRSSQLLATSTVARTRSRGSEHPRP
ncbi:DNA gyrase subunit A, partial [Janibacter hoylei PVAS-1]